MHHYNEARRDPTDSDGENRRRSSVTREKCATGGEPSTRSPPGELVEQLCGIRNSCCHDRLFSQASLFQNTAEPGITRNWPEKRCSPPGCPRPSGKLQTCRQFCKQVRAKRNLHAKFHHDLTDSDGARARQRSPAPRFVLNGRSSLGPSAGTYGIPAEQGWVRSTLLWQILAVCGNKSMASTGEIS